MASGGGDRKIGRNKKSAQNKRYLDEGRHRKSHVRRITKHLQRFHGDQMAQQALVRYGGKVPETGAR